MGERSLSERISPWLLGVDGRVASTSFVRHGHGDNLDWVGPGTVTLSAL
jgi:hypothetical protein